MSNNPKLAELIIPLERDAFLRDLLRHLSGTLQDVVGLSQAQGFISIVGQQMGESINEQYRTALKVNKLNREQVSAVLIDLKHRIQGEFSVISEDDYKIVLQGHSCPFGDKVKGRPALCMMTSNVFGTIAAENLGYAKVSLEETIANGASSCRVVVYLNENDGSKVESGMNILENSEYSHDCMNFSQVADKLPDGMLLVSANGMILEVNRKASQLLKVKSQELINQNISLIVNAELSVIIEKLKPYTRSRTPCQVPLKLKISSCYIADGFLFTPSTDTNLALIVLRVNEHDTFKNHFFTLNEKVNEQKKAMCLLRRTQDELKHELELRVNAENAVLNLNQQLEKKVRQRTFELESSLIELKQAQKILIQTEKMTSLGRLVAGVAHEINTPIGNCLLGISNIQEEALEVAQKLDKKILDESCLRKFLSNTQELSKAMLSSLHHTAELVSSFKQVSVDQHNETKRSFNLKSYCDSVILSFHGRFKNLPIELINSIDDSIEIHSFAGVFSQIITNLVMNSLIHGIEKEGKIELNANYHENFLIFTCEDDGVGIKEQLIDKVFDPFYTTKMGHGGSGLGLSIIHNLVTHNLKGEISCTSNVNKGTKIILNIPKTELIKVS